jgi:hypothetical protein
MQEKMLKLSQRGGWMVLVLAAKIKRRLRAGEGITREDIITILTEGLNEPKTHSVTSQQCSWMLSKVLKNPKVHLLENQRIALKESIDNYGLISTGRAAPQKSPKRSGRNFLLLTDQLPAPRGTIDDSQQIGAEQIDVLIQLLEKPKLTLASIKALLEKYPNETWFKTEILDPFMERRSRAQHRDNPQANRDALRAQIGEAIDPERVIKYFKSKHYTHKFFDEFIRLSGPLIGIIKLDEERLVKELLDLQKSNQEGGLLRRIGNIAPMYGFDVRALVSLLTSVSLLMSPEALDKRKINTPTTRCDYQNNDPVAAVIRRYNDHLNILYHGFIAPNLPIESITRTPPKEGNIIYVQAKHSADFFVQARDLYRQAVEELQLLDIKTEQDLARHGFQANDIILETRGDEQLLSSALPNLGPLFKSLCVEGT